MSLLSVVPRVCALSLLILAAFPWEARAEATPDVRCSALKRTDFTDVQDAPTQVTEATLAAARGDVPAHCRAAGYVAPQVGFELQLPLSAWNGKFLAIGNGGWGGVINSGDCAPYLKRGYACIASDTGHKGSRSADALWALNNLPAQVDYAFRATHVATLAGKAITSRYYSKAPEWSYFLGCSGGGYQGLVAAQLFPSDFNGIVVGAPTLNLAELSFRQVWNARQFFDEQGQPLLNAGQRQALHRAVLARCDRDDGVEDGIVGNPLACKVDPAQLLCKAENTAGCLNPAQVEAVRRLYAGPATSSGRALSISGVLPGSELNWADERFGLAFGGRGANFFRYEYYRASPGPDGAELDFDRDFDRLGMGALYSHDNPDLRRFRAAGGKLIAYQGGHDLTGLVREIVDYYDTVERTMGGRPATQDFFRLFMVPGMNHCSGGAGVADFGQELASSGEHYARALQDDADHHVLRALEAWVEKGRAPQRIVAARFVEGDASRGVAATRPLCPHPEFAVYSGAGDPRKAASFRCRNPSGH